MPPHQLWIRESEVHYTFVPPLYLETSRAPQDNRVQPRTTVHFKIIATHLPET